MTTKAQTSRIAAKLAPRVKTMPIIAEKVPGRNDICNCSYGKEHNLKYKNCCGKK